MTKSEMIKKMQDISFRTQGVGLQLIAGHMLKAAAATTDKERDEHLEGSIVIKIIVDALSKTTAIINTIHPDHLEVEELSELFCSLEKMSEEEIADWIINEAKGGTNRIENGERK